MKQMTGLDATFLYMETDSQFGHVSGLSIFERPSPSYEPFTAWRDSIERRLHLLEPLRRRAVQVPFGLDHPFWIEDPDFDLDYHVRHTAIPPPGADDDLARLVARLIGRPLDRLHPLWETYVIEGLPEDRFAVLTKVHHATVDGASGVELLTMMLDDAPEGSDDVPALPGAWTPEPVPSDVAVLTSAIGSLARKPGRLLLLSARTVRDVGRATRNPVMAAAGSQMRRSLRGPLGSVLNLGRPREESADTRPLRLPTGRAPRTPFNRSITPHRRFAFRTSPLSQVKDIKQSLGATVNDVVMAACAGGLRAYLELHDALPEEPLVAMVPVSIRTGTEEEKWTNRVSAMAATLPTDTADPLERLELVHEAMGNAKELFGAMPADTMTDFAQFSPPALFSQAMRLSTRMRLGNRLDPTANLIISNVPGPRAPLYAAGARLLHYYPVSSVAEGQGLNITVQSYLDNLDWGLVSCRELVPDLDVLLDLVLADLDAMEELAKGAPVAG